MREKIIKLKIKTYLIFLILLLVNCSTSLKRDISIVRFKNQKNLNLLITQNLSNEKSVIIIIDVFRAATTAAYVLSQKPALYLITDQSAIISQLTNNFSYPLLIGKAERGSLLKYDIANSPTRVSNISVAAKNVFHRTAAGAKGILAAKNADIVLLAGFANAKATARYVKNLSPAKIIIVPMGHEGNSPSLEDDLCAWYIKQLIENNDQTIEITSLIPMLKKDSGKYFFTKEQWEYPVTDFDYSLEIDRFNFAIRALVKKNYAILISCD